VVVCSGRDLMGHRQGSDGPGTDLMGQAGI
jgi:hypothetical protein